MWALWSRFNVHAKNRYGYVHAKNRYGYTHDAYLDGSSEKRGVRLTAELYDTGYWYKMSPVSA